MTFTPTMAKELAKPLDKAHVASRQQAGRSLSYVEGWHCIAEANRIFGYDGWTRETLALTQLGDPYSVDGKVRVAYSCRVRIVAQGIVREGCGFGQGIDKDVGQAHESALKEAETDAMKRALMTFGNPFGLALYDKSQANVQETLPASVEAFLDGLATALKDNKAETYWTEHWPSVPEDWRAYALTEKEKLKAANDEIQAVMAG